MHIMIHECVLYVCMQVCVCIHCNKYRAALTWVYIYDTLIVASPPNNLCLQAFMNADVMLVVSDIVL